MVEVGSRGDNQSLNFLRPDFIRFRVAYVVCGPAHRTGVIGGKTILEGPALSWRESLPVPRAKAGSPGEG